jgi:hypothetical protein
MMKKRLTPPLKMNIVNEMEMPAYLVKEREGHVPVFPRLRTYGPWTHHTSQLTPRGRFDLEGHERPLFAEDLLNAPCELLKSSHLLSKTCTAVHPLRKELSHAEEEPVHASRVIIPP